MYTLIETLKGNCNVDKINLQIDKIRIMINFKIKKLIKKRRGDTLLKCFL